MKAFEEYDAEYRSHVQACEEKLELAGAAATPLPAGRAALKQSSLLDAAERAVEAARDVVQLMELEGRALSGTARARLQTALRGSHNEVASLRARLKGLRAQQSDRIRAECFAGGNQHSDDERSQMLANNERIGMGTSRLKDAHQVTLDLEGTANSILADLSKQSETLRHTQGSLRYTADGLDTSRRVLTEMARRAAMNKLVLCFVISALVGTVVLFMSSGSTSSDLALRAREGGGSAGNEVWMRRSPKA